MEKVIKAIMQYIVETFPEATIEIRDEGDQHTFHLRGDGFSHWLRMDNSFIEDQTPDTMYNLLKTDSVGEKLKKAGKRHVFFNGKCHDFETGETD